MLCYKSFRDTEGIARPKTLIPCLSRVELRIVDLGLIRIQSSRVRTADPVRFRSFRDSFLAAFHMSYEVILTTILFPRRRAAYIRASKQF